MRLIDADALLEKCEFYETEMEVADAPTIDPVKHGHWHSRWYYRELTKAYDCEMHVCSECGSEWSHDEETGLSYNFCPSCGAKMDEVTE